MRLEHDVVDVDVDIVADLFLEARLHAALVGGFGVLEAEGHGGVVVAPKRRGECCLLLILDSHLDLVVAGVAVQKAERLTARRGVDDPIDPGE